MHLRISSIYTCTLMDGGLTKHTHSHTFFCKHLGKLALLKMTWLTLDMNQTVNIYIKETLST